MNLEALIGRILESGPVDFLGPANADGSLWEVVMIESGFSRNIGKSGLPRYYPEATLQRAVREGVFDSLKASTFRIGLPVIGENAFDHLPQQARDLGKKFAENTLGFFQGARYGDFTRPDGTKGRGVISLLGVLKGNQAIRENMVDAWKRRQYNLYALSIDADGEARVGVAEGRKAEIVERISRAESTDVVSAPAAGGSLLRLVASREGATTMDILLKLIQQSRPRWAQGAPVPAPEQKPGDYLRVLTESIKANIERELDGAKDATRLAEAGEGLQLIRKVLMLLEAGKADEAMELLKSAVASYPQAESAPKPPAPHAPAPAPAPASRVQEGVVDADRALAQIREQSAALARIAAEAETLTQAMRVRESASIVREALLASGLPEAAQKRVTRLFESKTGIARDSVDLAIADERAYIASFQESARTAAASAASAGAAAPVVMGDDRRAKLAKAMQGMMSGSPVEGLMFGSLQESWAAYGNRFYDRDTTGEVIFKAIAAAFPKRVTKGGFKGDVWDDPLGVHHRRLRESWIPGGSGLYLPVELREAVTTSDWSVAFGDSLYRRLEREYTDDPLNDWRLFADVMNLSDWTNKQRIIRRGKLGVLPIVLQNGPYNELSPVTPTEEVEELQPEKHGGKFKLTLEDVMADRLNVIRQIPRDLARASVRTIHEKVFDQIETNPVIQGNALISAANLNLVAGSPALAYIPVTDAVRLLRDQVELGSGKKLGFRPKYLLTGTKKENESIEITESLVKQTGTEDSTVVNVVRKWGMQSVSSLGVGRTAATENRWWVLTDKRDCEQIAVGFPGGRDRPDIFVQGEGEENQGSVFDADAVTFKVRLICGAKIVDFRGITGSLAAA